MRPSWKLLLALAVAAGLAGCSRNNNSVSGPGAGGAGLAQSQVAAEIARQPSAVDDGIADDPTQVTLGTAPVGAAALINPLTYWRTIRSVDRTFTIAFSDSDSTGQPTRAVVVIHKRLQGSFNILTGPLPSDSTMRDSAMNVVRKPLDDRWVRRVLLRRLTVLEPPDSAERDDDRDRPWRVVATSGVDVTSQGATTHIQSLEIRTALRDTTVTDPLAFWRLRELIKVQPGEQVTLIVTTGRNDDVVVLNSRDHRFRFHNNGDGTYTAQWAAGLWVDGIRHIGVNALSHGTLFDDAAPYDSEQWILPFVIVPDFLGDFLR